MRSVRLGSMNMFGLVGVVGLGLVGCSQLWGGQTRPDPGNCVAITDLCSAGQHCNLQTEACEFDTADMGVVDLATLPAAPSSFVLPGGEAGVFTMQTYPRDANYALAARDASATIYYTLDGSNPVPSARATMAGPTPVMLTAVPGGTTVHWFADYGPAFLPEPVRSFTALTSPNSPDTFGFIPEPIQFDPDTRPLIKVSPGQTVTATLPLQAWGSTPTGYCPSCIVQVVVSVTTLGVVQCIENIQGIGPYPGGTTRLTLSFTAPTVPGRYAIFAGITLQFNCDGTVANGADVGEILVE